MQFNNNWTGVDSSPIIKVTRPGNTEQEVETWVDAKGVLSLCVNNDAAYLHDCQNATIDLDRETAMQLALLLTFYNVWGRLPVNQEELNQGIGALNQSAKGDANDPRNQN